MLKDEKAKFLPTPIECPADLHRSGTLVKSLPHVADQRDNLVGPDTEAKRHAATKFKIGFNSSRTARSDLHQPSLSKSICSQLCCDSMTKPTQCCKEA